MGRRGTSPAAVGKKLCVPQALQRAMRRAHRAATSALSALAEDLRADAHVGGAEGDGRLEVGAHAHAELREAQLAGELGEEGEMHAGLLVERRDAHQAGDVELQLVAAQAQQAGGLLRHDAGLLRLLAGVDLDEELQAPALLGHLLGDGCGDLGPVDGVDRIEQGDGLLGLVGLQRADQVQLDVGIALAQRRPLGLGLLHAVLAEQAMAGVEDGLDMLGAERLGDGDELDGGRVALGAVRGGGDAAAGRRRARCRSCAVMLRARACRLGLVLGPSRVGLEGVVVAEQHVEIFAMQEDLVAPDLFLLQHAQAAQAP